MALTHTDLRSDETLRQQGFTAKEIENMHDIAAEYWGLLVDLDEAEAEKNWSRHNDLEDKIKIAEFRLLYLGLHPRDVPTTDLVHMTRSELSDNGAATDPIIHRYRSKISNPATAIRANCVSCMGGSVAEVRRCELVNCPTWPFRMGHNPLSGKALMPAAQIEIEDDDVTDIDESTDSGDASE